MKRAGTITKIGIFVIMALVVLIASFPHIVNATDSSQNQSTSAISTENKTPKKERKAKFENMTDEEKQALKAERKAKFENMTDEEKEALKAERKAKFENMTDEEKQALKNKKPEKKERKSNNAENSQSTVQ